MAGVNGLPMVETHCHLIPGVDDGAKDAAESAAALVRYRAEGVGRVVATPHFDASTTTSPAALEAGLAALDGGWARLQALDAGGIELMRGVELRLDTPHPILDDPRLRLAGTSFVLVEFYGFSIPPSASAALKSLSAQGIRPVLAHPERYRGLAQARGHVSEWVGAGAVMQINAGSLLGWYGREIEANAWWMIGDGSAHIVAGDYHSRGNVGLSAARDRLAEAGLGSDAIELLFSGNAERVLADHAPFMVPPLKRRRTWLQTLRGLLRR